jgi:hypothetical protein
MLRQIQRVQEDELPPESPDEIVLASWRYAVLFSVLLTTTMFLLGVLWMWLRDGSLHDIGFMLVTWALVTIVAALGVKWGWK